MNIINKLTLRHMKLNKKRTLVTIIGIIIAVAMITAVSTVCYSVMDYFARVEMVTEGYFHLKFQNYYYRDNEELMEEMDVENYSLMKPLGDYFYDENFDDGSVVIEPYVLDNQSIMSNSAFRIVAVQDNYYDMVSINLISGAYPQNENELLISEKVVAFSDKKVGDKLIVGEKEYTVCGIVMGDEFEWGQLSIPNVIIHPMYTRLDTDTLQEGDIVSSYLYIDGIVEGLEKNAEEIKKNFQNRGVPIGQLIGETEKWYCDGVGVFYNYDVLEYLGISKYTNVNAVMNSFKLILIMIVMVGGVSLIANGFAISISERNKYIGMITSVGATKKQKRSSVYFEGFLEGIIAIPIGIIAGIAGIGITFELISPITKDLSGTDTELRLVINYSVISWAILFSIMTIFLSAYYPAKKASKIPPVEAIKQTKDVKLSNKTVKTMGITRKIFGFEGELALKNLKRNKKRYRITIFSMCVSLILFISVYSMIYYLKEGVNSELGDIGYDMSIQRYINPIQDIEEQLEPKMEFEKLTETLLSKGNEYIDGYSRYLDIYLRNRVMQVNMIVDKWMYNGKRTEFMDKCNMDDTARIRIIAMNETDLERYLKSIDIDYNEFISDVDNVILYDAVKTVCYTSTERLIYNGPIISEEIDKIPYVGTTFKENEIIIENEMTGESIVDYEYIENGSIEGELHIYERKEKPMGLSQEYVYVLITPKKAQQFKEYGSNEIYNMVMDVNDDEIIEQLYYKLLDESVDNSDYFSLDNCIDYVIDRENSLLLVSIFTYGFIILMTLICVANIVNTISTSFALRKREFAMLKSVGMTDRQFNRMIAYESAFYGLKAILFGLPIGTVIMLSSCYMVGETYGTDFSIPWLGYVIAITGVFVVTGFTMFYSSRKIKKANIIEALRDDNA